MNITHMLSPRSCLNHLRITGEADIQCDVCGRRFGFTYSTNPIRAFIYQKYIRFRPEITRFIRDEADDPPGIDEWVEFNSNFLSEIREGLMSVFDENIISEDDDEEDVEVEVFEDE